MSSRANLSRACVSRKGGHQRAEIIEVARIGQSSTIQGRRPIYSHDFAVGRKDAMSSHFHGLLSVLAHN